MSNESCTIVPLGACPASALQLQPDGKTCIIGRSAGASLRLDHQSISRQHASLVFSNGRWAVTDLGSRHGTTLNGVALEVRQPMPLRSGDRIGLNPWVLRFDMGQNEGATIVQASSMNSGGTVVVMAPSKEKSQAQIQLDLLITSSVSIYAAATEVEMVTEVAKVCVQGTKCERALIVRFLDSGSGSRLEVVGEWPAGAIAIRPVSRTLLNGASKGKPVRLSEDDSFGSAQSIIGTGVNGAACIPIMIDSTIEAYLYLDEFEGKVNYEDVLSFSQAIGRWTGLSLMRLQRFELESRQRELLEELAAARQVQERMMGATSGNKGEVSWAMCSIPGQVVAGDIFGVHRSPTQLGATVFLGDVSGKGLGPGLLMAAITAHLEAQLSAGVRAEKAICDLSNFVSTRAVAGQFATFTMAEVDCAARKIHFIDAGHGYYCVVDRNGNAKPVDVDGGIPIGVVEDFLYESNEISLAKGDRLVLYSDGLAEQRNDEGEMLGPVRVAAALVGSLTCADDVNRLTELLKAFAKNLKYADDVTIASLMLAADVEKTHAEAI
ncbi:MAG: SpoIIE family protein phosphatase [Planctomycetota bacterium]|nr:SpoIIE family protein phosphatase [Planctomycetota bacterium]